MARNISDMATPELWAWAARALSDGRLRDAKSALDEIGLRYDDAYSRLEEAVQKQEQAPDSKVYS